MKYALTLALLSSVLVVPTAVNADVDTNPPDIESRSGYEDFLTLTNEVLPESRAVNAEFLNTDYNPYLDLNQEANIYVSFLDEGAGYKNSLGYFTFENDSFSGLTKGDIDTDNSGVVSLNELNAIDGVNYGFLFPNLSKTGGGGSLDVGDTVHLGQFDADTNVSFFLTQNSYLSGDYISDDALTGVDQTFYGLDFLNPEADFTYEFGSSSQTSRHVAMLFADDNQEQVIMGFEDLNRADNTANDWNIGSDEDFNDAIFMISSDPVDAFSGSNIATAPLPPMAQSLIGLAMVAGMISMARKRASRPDQELIIA
ncbi:DUF4114 domain-containing protein [Enterovibrio sp. ZSDZ35]|uniref:DUF4114 domain-containing protein n=1 Tax=Enterovibrio qingdaonensis TaxID=2899818 RepID=A0ABT5QSI6_9GAMM|nr:DUF4114 domain-containing protein [Enterovibrio sp. ZSDZ35]MDD1783950.1 DUF4114 domain-containing protein [Enterovibrio sp. ZSDZ35]